MITRRELTEEDYLAILRRRKWWLLLPLLVGPGLAMAIYYFIPAQYTSKTVVLVQQQKVPDEYVRSVISDDLNSRLASMQEQILSRSRLEPILTRFGLYQRKQLSMEQRVEQFRKDILVAPLHSVPGARAGITGFSISVKAGEPHMAQEICSEISSMFLSENLRARERRAKGTTEFLRTQLETAKNGLDEQDAKLAVFQRKYMGRLPDQEQTSFSMLTSLNTQAESLNQNYSQDAQQKAYLESMLSQELATWKSTQAPEIKLNNGDQPLRQAESELAALQAKYMDEHPDVQRKKYEIAQLKAKLAEHKVENGGRTTAPTQEPPQIRQLRAQLSALDGAMARNRVQAEEVQRKIRAYEARIELTPMVQEEYKKLTRDYQTALQFYNDLLTKKNQSEMATDLEKQQQGEQFTVMDPPNLPATPTSPQKPLFVGAGVLAGLLFGLGSVVLLEFNDKTLRSEEDVVHCLQLPILGELPDLPMTVRAKSGDLQRKRPASRISADARNQHV